MKTKKPAFRATIRQLFGEKALEPALFYHHNPALRFSLSQSGNAIQQFSNAYDRGRDILQVAFADTEKIFFVATAIGTASHFHYRGSLRSLHACHVVPTHPYELWYEAHDELWRVFLAFEGDKAWLEPLLWGTLARDLAIQPALDCRIYAIAPELGILAHPYDDRGMDIIGNPQRLHTLYQRFNHYLLEYDRARMTRMLHNV